MVVGGGGGEGGGRWSDLGGGVSPDPVPCFQFGCTETPISEL